MLSPETARGTSPLTPATMAVMLSSPPRCFAASIEARARDVESRRRQDDLAYLVGGHSIRQAVGAQQKAVALA